MEKNMKFPQLITNKEKAIHFFCLIYLVPFLFLLVINTLFSMLQTTYMELYLDTEKPLYKSDLPIFLLICTFLFTLMIFLFFKKRKITLELCSKLEKLSLSWSVMLSLFFIFIFRVRVACDSAHLSDIAIAFLNGDYSSLTGDGYLVHYPHQLGMIGLLEIVYAIFGIENYTVLQFLNVVAIFVAIYYLHRITEEMFHQPQIQILLSLLCIGLLPLYLYSTFIYGDIPGLGLAVPAIYYVIRYINSRRKLYAFPAALCMTLSMILKSNNMVILTAIMIILLLHTIQNKDKFAIAFLLLLIGSYSLASHGINSYYVHASGLDHIPSGIPKVAWVAMGLQENDYLENGWYNSYNWNVYSENSHDTDATTKVCIESIQNSLQRFVESPGSCIRFFYKKFISQWNDPGYQSQITVEWYSRHRDDHSNLALYLIYGNGRLILEAVMNLYHFMILLGASIFAFCGLRERKLVNTLLSLCVFGGYFFHMFWEAGGRYGLGYFVLCVPMAAFGFWKLSGWLNQLLTHFRRKQ